MLEDLAQHLAYHASVGFAECRDMDPPAVPAIEVGVNVAFSVEHAGKHFRIVVEEYVPL